MSAKGSVKSGFDSDSDPVGSDRSSSPVVDYNDDDDDVDDEEEESEEAEETESEEEDEDHPNIVWTGYAKRIPVVLFKADTIVTKRQEARNVGEKYHLAYKLMKTECKLLRSLMSAHGFHEAHPNSSDFNLMWTGSHLKPYVLRGLQDFQKVNHFPRSYEITRKDRLFKNVQRLQQTKGFKNFDFVPQSYIIPGEFQDFCSGFLKDKGPYIVKPIASSRGRGIFLVNHPEQVPLDETMIVSKYIHNPLLVDGFKSDIRLYVAVTSYDPLIIYLYEEGLTRFATVKYDKAAKNIRNQCMHLTNYSVNKKSAEYVANDDPDVEDYGNKWSLGAMLRYLRSLGKDTVAIMMRIEDVIIKTLISAEMPIATACKMFMPHRGNCFELYGFDIMIDENLRPWVLEVNLSPSLNCDAPIDLKIKSNMMADLFSLVGFVCQDPMIRKGSQGKRSQDINGRPLSRTQRDLRWKPKRQRPMSANSNKGSARALGVASGSGLTGEEIRVVRRAKEEYQRRGGWIRIFPSPDSWELYGSFLQSQTTHNLMLYQQLYPDRAKTVSSKPTTASYSSSLARTKTIHLHSSTHPQLLSSAQTDEGLASGYQRIKRYERKLSSLGGKQKKATPAGNNKKKPKPGTSAPLANGVYRGTLVQGIPEDTTPAASKQTNSVSPSKPNTSPTQKPQPAPQQPQKTMQGPQSLSKPQTAPSKAKPQMNGQQVKAGTGQRAGMHGKENTPPKPQTAPTDTSLNVVSLLEKGRTMSKVQARFAFATYLMRVQNRLLTETNSSQEEDVDAANEQMDLVLRFLKRAAGNLQQPFKVTVPSRKLPLNDRRRILAKQLGDFVHIYNKETETLKQRNNLERKHLKRPPNFSQNEGFDEDRFNKFVSAATENDLEDVLTTYTKLNKSASIFLGSNSKSSYSSSSNTSSTLSHSDPSLSRRKEVSGDGLSSNRSQHSGQEEASTSKVGNHGDSSELMTTAKEAAYPGSLAANSGLSSFAKAVSIYSSKLAAGVMGGSVRSRPVSGGSANSRNTVGRMRSRPLSANTSRASSSTTYKDHCDRTDSGGDNYDEEVINAALHRLTLRQQQRQYTAGLSVHLLENNTDVSSSHAPSEQAHPDPTHRPSNNHYSNRSHSISNSNYHNANQTFNSFVEDTLSDAGVVEAYQQATGSVPISKDYSPSPGSTQHMIAQQNLQLKQQRMSQQSRAQTENSRAKHQAMVAQAHAAKHSFPTQHADGALTPKPPPAKPPAERKPASAHRLARTSMLDDNSAGDFYNSLKYDHYTGTAKPVHSSGHNTGNFDESVHI